MIQTTTIVQTDDQRADELIQKLGAIQARLENDNHENLKSFVNAIEEADELHDKSSQALDEIIADMDALESETAPSQGE